MSAMSYDRLREITDRLRVSGSITPEEFTLVSEVLASEHQRHIENDYLMALINRYSGGPDVAERLRQNEKQIAIARNDLRISERDRRTYRERMHRWYSKFLEVKHENNKLRAKLFRQEHRKKSGGGP